MERRARRPDVSLWLAGFDAFSAHAQSSMLVQGRAPMMGSRGGMTGMGGHGGMHGSYRPGWGHRGIGLGYGVPLGVIEIP